MGFFERIGNGFSIGFFSIFYPLRHPRLYVYFLINCIIMGMAFSFIGLKALSSQLLLTSPSNLVSFVVYVVGSTLASIVMVGLIRVVVGSYQGKSYGFFQAMELTGVQLFYIFLFNLFNIFVGQLKGLAPQSTVFGVVVGLCTLLIIPIGFFFLPVVVFESTGLFDTIGRSLRYFGRGIIEIIAIMVVVMTTSGILTAIFMGSVIFLVGAEQLQLAARGSISWLSLFMPIMWLVVIFGIIFWWLITGFATIGPTMYDYLTHDRKNPLK